jgi:hypothetical protein
LSLNRYAKRRDGNEHEIVDALEKIGCLVHRLDWPDLLIQRGKDNFLMEVKTKRGKPTDFQKIMKEYGWKVDVARTVDEALAVVGIKL